MHHFLRLLAFPLTLLRHWWLMPPHIRGRKRWQCAWALSSLWLKVQRITFARRD